MYELEFQTPTRLMRVARNLAARRFYSLLWFWRCVSIQELYLFPFYLLFTPSRSVIQGHFISTGTVMHLQTETSVWYWFPYLSSIHRTMLVLWTEYFKFRFPSYAEVGRSALFLILLIMSKISSNRPTCVNPCIYKEINKMTLFIPLLRLCKIAYYTNIFFLVSCSIRTFSK